MTVLRAVRDLHQRSLPSRRVLTFAVVSTAIGGLAQLLLMASLGYLLAWSAVRPALSAIVGILTVVELLAFFRAPLRYHDRLRSHAVAFASMRSWRLWLFDRLIPLSPGGLGGRQVGDVLATAMSDVDGLGDLYIRVLVPLVGATFPITVGIGFLATQNGWVAGIAAGLCVSGLFLIGRDAARGGTLATELAESQGRRTGVLLDALQGATTLTKANGWGRPLSNAAELEHHIAKVNKSLGVLTARRSFIASALSSIVVLCAVGSVLSRNHVGDPRLLIALVTMSIGLGELVSGAGLGLASLDGVLSSWSRLQALAERQPPMASGSTMLPATPLGIEAQRLTLTYTAAKAPAFSDLSFSVRPKQLLLITGPSGSGKTSVLICLLGLWPRGDGVLKLNEVSFDDLDHDHVRSCIGTHLSDSVLFSGTVRSNLETTGATEDDMVRALNAVGLPGPEFLDRQIFEQGRGLSGGEQLRVSILRALLSDSIAVLLDEPTAQLDELSAARVVKAISTMAPNKTVVVVAHEDGTFDADETLQLTSRQ